VAIFVSDGATIRNNTCWKNGTRGNETGELSLLGSRHSVHNNIAVPRDGAVALTLRLQNSVWSSDFSTVSANHNILWAPTHTEVVHFGENYWRTVAQYQAENVYGWGADSLQASPMLVDPDNQDFSLADGSPAIDSGDPSHAAERSVTEQARPCDGDGDGDAVVDRGAHEMKCAGQPGEPGGSGGSENPGGGGSPGGADGSGGGCSVGPTPSADLVWFGLLAVILLRRRRDSRS
jgi:MYXO-CTERM domain-containing protein